MAKQSKRMKKVSASVATGKTYSLKDAVSLLKQNATCKFDETVEVAMNLNIDPRKAEQNIRGMVAMPNGTGKTVRVAVFAKAGKADEAKAAGADVVGAEDLIEKVSGGWLEFDACLATPDMMGAVGKLGRVLGTRGLMPNPKLGTVTNDIAAAVKAAKGGQVEYRAEKAGIIHAGVGKVSFAPNAIEENIRALLDAVLKAKPTGVKGTYVKQVTLSTTMGAGVPIDLSELSQAS